jgi:hypothetical protein
MLSGPQIKTLAPPKSKATDMETEFSKNILGNMWT